MPYRAGTPADRQKTMDLPWRAGFHRRRPGLREPSQLRLGLYKRGIRRTEYEGIDWWFFTWDLSFLARRAEAADIALSIPNVPDTDPPPVTRERSYDGFAHIPGRRRIKPPLTYRPGR